MSLISEKTMRLGAILVGSFIVIALLPATALAYVGILWLRASERGWQTQVAAAALVVGWVALVVGAAFTWKAVNRRTPPTLFVGGVSCVVAIAAYAVVYEWGGLMLI